MHSEQGVRLGAFQQSNHLGALHAGEAIQKIIDGVACFQMVKQAFDGHPRAREHHLTAKNFWILICHEVVRKWETSTFSAFAQNVKEIGISASDFPH